MPRNAGSLPRTLKRTPDAPDVPEFTAAMAARAEIRRGNRVIRAGRPKGSGTKAATTIRLDRDVLARFQKGGRGWQTRINAALREWISARTPDAENPEWTREEFARAQRAGDVFPTGVLAQAPPKRVRRPPVAATKQDLAKAIKRIRP